MRIGNPFFEAPHRVAHGHPTPAEIEESWREAKKAFQARWPRKERKLIFIIQEGEQHLDDEAATDVMTELSLVDRRMGIDLVLHTHGGSAVSADRISAMLVRRKRTASFVPFYAESGGTQIALSTQMIFFGRGAALTGVEVEAGGWPAHDIIELARARGDNASEDLALLARTAERAVHNEARRLRRMINFNHKGFLGWRGRALSERLAGGHGELIRYRAAKRLGLWVRRGVPSALYEFVGMRREQLRMLRELHKQVTLVQHPTRDPSPPPHIARQPEVRPSSASL